MLKHIAALSIGLSLFAMPAFAQDAAAIAKVQSGQSCAGCNLFQADLAYRDAKKLDLSGARLRQSNLSLATYDDVNLTGANLSVANLFGARFNRANFKDANLQNATAVGTFFGSSNLSGANLTGANLSGADLKIARGLSQAQLNSACGDASTQLPSGKTIPTCS
ncbi:MAG: pentapeptide repeat-containing protein [Pseudomonadota bacterium]